MADTGFTALRQFSFTTRPYLAVDDETGAPIGLDDLDVRVGWLLDLISGAEAQLLSRLWQPATFDVLAAGCDRQGRKLPMQGHVAAARLGWTPHYPDGVYVPSRVTRVVTAQAVGTLRALAYRDTAIIALSARFDPATGRIAAPTTAAEYVPSGFARGVVRQLAAHARGAADARLRITDVQGPPQTSAMARLSAADRQLAQLAVTGHELVLTVKLPTCPAPAGRAQWRSVRLSATIPEHLHGRAVTDWHLPTLSSTAGDCSGGAPRPRSSQQPTWNRPPSRSGWTGPRPLWVPPPSPPKTPTGCPRITGVGPTTTAGSGSNWPACRPRGSYSMARRPG
ncbi:transposase [Rhodococcus opacus M213]|uniref:Transposase n=1 Tax=Rhodococcus opacus M213 TaxID=1129896 RepID=K8XQ51_RHOOP|nr:transposase [Rhodococcus opacus M213]